MPENSVELGDFLRARRERLTPRSVGLPEGRRRRTPGLRREEVAELAGIGVDWYIRLEQGRSASPSRGTVEALARALRLNRAEHAHLRALTQPSERPPVGQETVPQTVRRIVERLNQPAYVTGRRWDVLAWNQAADEVFAFSRTKAEDRNSLVTVFTNKHARRMFGGEWENEARRMLAQFRRIADLHAGDPAFQQLIARLRKESKEFAAWWRAHDVHQSGGGRKEMHHPRKGVLRFDYASFQVHDEPGLKLVIYTPA
jgi:transcriptional regulator with XRE-family HTH domain